MVEKITTVRVDGGVHTPLVDTVMVVVMILSPLVNIFSDLVSTPTIPFFGEVAHLTVAWSW